MTNSSIWQPVIYVTILIGSLLVFSHYHRKRNAGKPKFEPWFPTHPERDVYVTLLQKSAPESLLKAALLRRATADVNRIVRIREDKQALQNLMQKGCVGDDLWSSCLAAEKELEAEILEVVNEANTFHQGWGQIIFASASEIMHHDKIKEALNQMPKLRLEAEAKYGHKKVVPNIPKTSSTLSSPSVDNDSSATPEPVQSSTGALTTESATAPSNGAAQLSDGESADSSAVFPQPTIDKSRKSSGGGKKGKKRK